MIVRFTKSVQEINSCHIHYSYGQIRIVVNECVPLNEKQTPFEIFYNEHVYERFVQTIGVIVWISR